MSDMPAILFRGKRLEIGEFATVKICDWVYGGYVKDCSGEYIYSIMNTPRMVKVDTATIGQYTGLPDKNGVKIFDGDICRNSRTGEVVSVHWHGTMAGFVWSKRKNDGTYLSDWGALFRVHDKYEVIGNIHDNPEFLEGCEGNG